MSSIIRFALLLSNSSPKSRLQSWTRSWLCVPPVTTRWTARRTTTRRTRNRTPQNLSEGSALEVCKTHKLLNHLLKNAFYGRRASMEENLQLKTTFNGKGPSMKDDLWWKTHWNIDDFWLKTIFDGRLLIEDNLQWKTTFDVIWPYGWHCQKLYNVAS